MKKLIFLSLLTGLMACSDTPAPPPAQVQPRTGPDALNGRQLFRECAVCHTATAEGAHRIGPNLWGVYGRESGMASGFAYSNALKNADIVWDDAALDAYLENPPKYIPNGRMAYRG
ncbi:MAG: c-type cytochrome, partial [Pseudomonadota bacterium]